MQPPPPDSVPALLVRASHCALHGGFTRRTHDLDGLQPGPMLFKENPQFVWAVIASMYIGNVMLLVLNLPLVGMWARICTIPFYILGPLIVFFSVLGTYSIRFVALDVWDHAHLRGDRGTSCEGLDFPSPPWCWRASWRRCWRRLSGQSLLISRGSPLSFFLHPSHRRRLPWGLLVLSHRPGDLGSRSASSLLKGLWTKRIEVSRKKDPAEKRMGLRVCPDHRRIKRHRNLQPFSRQEGRDMKKLTVSFIVLFAAFAVVWSRCRRGGGISRETSHLCHLF